MSAEPNDPKTPTDQDAPSADATAFQEDPDPRKPAGGNLVLSLDGFEGPIDLLLSLARDQKVDLTKISILALANQYLDFIAHARSLRLEIAADYLVMAAWLAYLKSRLLLPAVESDEEGPDPAELAARLAFQLQRLEAMQKVARELFALPQLGQDVFGRGAPEQFAKETTTVFDVSLFDLLKAYGEQQSRQKATTLRIMPTALMSMEQAIVRLRGLVGEVPDWTVLERFVPPDIADPLVARSAIASTFAATLELAREGVVEIRQAGTYGPIYVRKSP